MKIAIPTDFSELSKVAVLYASKIALKLGAELILVNVVQLDRETRINHDHNFDTILEHKAKNAQQKCLALINQIKKEGKIKLTVGYSIVKGNPLDHAIESYVKLNKIDLIIMATKGAIGLKKIIGSNTASIISNSDVPVIAVPEYAIFRGLKNIVYATDLWDLFDELKYLIPYAELFDSTIHVVHVKTGQDNQKINPEKLLLNIKKKLNYPNINLSLEVNEDILEGISQHMVEVDADLIVMPTHEHTFFEKLFGKSVTRKMAFHTDIPLMTINKESI